MAEAKSEGKDGSGASADTSKSGESTDQKVDTKPDDAAGSTSGESAGTTSDGQTETKSETKPDTKTDAKPAAKPSSKSSAKTSTKNEGKTDAEAADKKSGRSTKETVQSVRKGVASAIWLLSVLAALILAAGALVIALDFNRDNAVVHFFIHAADNINFLGTMKKFEPTGKSPSAVHSALVKTVLVNWGICAVVYLVVGKILDRIIRP